MSERYIGKMRRYPGESKAPAEGPRMGSKIKEPRGGAGMREAMSLHKRGGQPREKHGWGGDVGNWIKGAANTVGNGVMRGANAVANSPGAQQIRGVVNSFDEGGRVKCDRMREKRFTGGLMGKMVSKVAGRPVIEDLAKRVARIEKHMRGGRAGRGR